MCSRVGVLVISRSCATQTEEEFGKLVLRQVVHVLLNTTTRRDINGEIVGFFAVGQDLRFVVRIGARRRTLSLLAHAQRCDILCVSVESATVLETLPVAKIPRASS